MLPYLQTMCLVASLHRRRSPNKHSHASPPPTSGACRPAAVGDSLAALLAYQGLLLTLPRPCSPHEHSSLPCTIAPPLSWATLDLGND